MRLTTRRITPPCTMAIISPTNIHWSSDLVIDTVTTDHYLTCLVNDGFSGWNIDLIVDFDNCN